MILRGRLSDSKDVVDVVVDNGRILDIAPPDVSKAADAGDASCLIAPGFIDIQLNGFEGIDFNDPSSSISKLAEMPAAIARTGVTTFCPTVITASTENISGWMTNIISACKQSRVFRRDGLHSSRRTFYLAGRRATWSASARACPPSRLAEFRRWQETAEGRIRIITLSPEWPEAVDFIERASAENVIVAIGHTVASPAMIADAVRAGARLSTHLGNGSHAKIDRHPNYIWEQLAQDHLWASFIVDGHHLPPSVVKSFLRCKGFDRSILVTDAIAAAGNPPGRYRLGDVDVELTQDRKVCLPGTPYLAGSVLEMHQAVANTVHFSDASITDAPKDGGRKSGWNCLASIIIQVILKKDEKPIW
ncbi:MAG: N-acetylglucosamine-6-phosphate deacetylase [Acidobacteria bacterium]|nr:N-acetylglucosamine-6-phosphate deacetylase [Acidobacteriota bacterium]